MRSTRPTEQNAICADRDCLLDFEDSLALKDFSPEKAKKVVPELSPIIDHLVSLLPVKAYFTVDVMMHNFVKDGQTCVDVSPHVDGVGNEYVIWSIGDFRTEFLITDLDIPELGVLEPMLVKPLIRKAILENDVCFVEAPESVPMRYDSRCIHRGRRARAGSKRLMIRVCSSNYIKPKNVNLTKRLQFGAQHLRPFIISPNSNQRIKKE